MRAHPDFKKKYEENPDVQNRILPLKKYLKT
jgi:hypothetical protein